MSTDSDIARPGIPAARILLLAGGIAVGAAGAAVYFLLDPTRVMIFPPCLFHELTGLDCPGCGAQRALHQLLHGNVIAAIRLNAMFVLSLPLLAWIGARFLIAYCRNKPVDIRFRWWGLYIAAWIVFGVLRNLPIPPFSWFAA
jgi:hypothetical protein